MAGNSFGQLFRITTFGESHGPVMGVVIDGCPAGLTIDTAFIQRELDRRRPGQSEWVSQRKEADAVKIVSGVYNNVSLGSPIAMLFENEDARPADYRETTHVYRPSHADYVYDRKYGMRDPRGGGRSSARETVARVAAGAVAKLLLLDSGISVSAFTSAIGKVAVSRSYSELNLDETEKNPVRCPDKKTAAEMVRLIEQVRSEGDTVGGVITCVVRNCPVGLGEPVFDKLHADLAKAMMSINAAHGFEYGSGFGGAMQKGSEQNDLFMADEKSGKVSTMTNNSGGIQGGISNGMDIYFRVAFKPVSTLLREQPTVNTELKPDVVKMKGRHDPCVVPRAVPIVEAMAALVMADHLLRNRNSKMG